LALFDITHNSAVMPAHGAGIHEFGGVTKKVVDARAKPGHDG
jgi:hypothetical protein